MHEATGLLLTTYQLARLLGTSRSSILRYEEAGILVPVSAANDANASRLYDIYSVLKLKIILEHKRVQENTLITYRDLNELDDVDATLQKLQEKFEVIKTEIRDLVALSDRHDNIPDTPRIFPSYPCLRVHIDEPTESNCINQAMEKGIAVLAQHNAALLLGAPFLVEINKESVFNAETPREIERLGLLIPCSVLPDSIEDTDEYRRDFFEPKTRMVVNLAEKIDESRARFKSELQKHNVELCDEEPIIGLVSGYKCERGEPLTASAYLLTVNMNGDDVLETA